jgi:outer membrane protein
MRTLPLLLVLTTQAVSARAESQVLTLDQALAAAREHQPQLQQAQATTQAARARADQARASLLPQVGASASYQRSTANFVARPGSLPTNISSQGSTSLQWTTYGFYNFGLSASQLLWDFGTTPARWRSARESAASLQESERATFLQAMDAVRQAFFQARANRALVTVASETLANQDRHLQQVQAFVEVGTHPEIDLAQSRADRANALVQLITAQNNYETAKAQLNQAMGVEQSTDYDLADDAFPPVPGEEQDTEPLLTEALDTRPELAAAARAVRAQELAVRSMRGAFWPSLSAATGVSDAGGVLNDLAWNWNASLSLSVPLFRGGQIRAQLTEAESTLRALQAEALLVRQQIRLDIEQARLGVKAAKAALDAAGDALVNAEELLRLAEGRYETGVGYIIELGDAQVARTSAAQQKVQAEYKLAAARAQLLRAIGRT